MWVCTQPVEGWVPLGGSVRSAAIMDPLSGNAGMGRVRKSRTGVAEVFLKLEPGESLFLRTFIRRRINARRFPGVITPSAQSIAS